MTLVLKRNYYRRLYRTEWRGYFVGLVEAWNARDADLQCRLYGFSRVRLFFHGETARRRARMDHEIPT